MRIARGKNTSGNSESIHEELAGLCRTQPSQWPVCGPNCPSPEARRCHRDCPYIPRALSDQPEKFALEPLVAPLVYELHRLDGFRTCWSCEGHDRLGTLWKQPQVWFYTDCQVHARILADALSALHMKKMLRSEWEVAVTFSDPDNPDTTYTLRPRQSGETPTLNDLRADMKTLAGALADQCRRSANALRMMT